jgi:hypothetical protein
MRKEALASATITPGMLIERLSTGKVAAHATAGGYGIAAFAIENEVYAGQGEAPTIDTNYAADDLVQYGVFQPGQEVYALLAANAAAIVVGDKLVSQGAGYVKKVVTTDVVLAIALQAVDNSAGGTPVRIKIEIV